MGFGAAGPRIEVPVNFWSRWNHWTSAENVRFLTGVQRVTTPSCETLKFGLQLKSADFNCNPDFNVSQLGVVTRWTPVKNLTFSAEVQWFHLDQKFAGTSVLGAAAPKPTTVYQFKDQDAVSLQLRAQRNF